MPDLIDRAVEYVRSDDYIDLTVRQLAVLGMALKNIVQPLPVREVAAQLSVSKPVVTRAVSTLERLGLVERQRGRDKRDRFVAVTPAGERFRETLEGGR